MKRVVLPFLLTFLALGLNSCVQDQCEQTLTYLSYTPVYQSFDEIRASVQSEPAQALKQPGKLYFKDQFIFISELGEGIHIINNADPTNPVNEGFIRIPGTRDLAIKGEVLYADSYVDLLALDISDMNDVQVLSREQDVFPYGDHHPGLWADPDSGIAVDWIEQEVTEEFPCNSNGGWGRNFFGMEDAISVSVFASNSSVAPTVQGGSETPTGVGGSMARFTLTGDYLYAVTISTLQSFDISNLADPVAQGMIELGWGVETIFPMYNHLFIGTMTGMLIYDLENPAQPAYKSEFAHVRSCDPVVVEGDYAYVTLRGGNDCGSTVNQLDILDISDLSNPWLVKSYSMTNPHGLGIRDGVLFICDGDAGLRVYDATEPTDLEARAHFEDIHAFDVIPLRNLLLMIGEGGFYQYDYSDLDNVKQISLIPVAVE